MHPMITEKQRLFYIFNADSSTNLAGEHSQSYVGSDESRVVGKHDGRRPIAGAELGEDARDVALDRALAEVQLGGDFGVRRASSDELEHLDLTLRQALELSRSRPCR